MSEAVLNRAASQKEITIKRAEIVDLPAMNKLMYASKAHWNYSEQFMQTFMDMFALKEADLKTMEISMLQENQKTIGFFSFDFADKEMTWLSFFLLDANAIGKGYGNVLWDEVVKFSQLNGVREFHIWSDPNATGFYVKKGCQVVGEKESPVVQGRILPVLSFKANEV